MILLSLEDIKTIIVFRPFKGQPMYGIFKKTSLALMFHRDLEMS
jgi:hypothetical protein